MEIEAQMFTDRVRSYGGLMLRCTVWFLGWSWQSHSRCSSTLSLLTSAHCKTSLRACSLFTLFVKVKILLGFLLVSETGANAGLSQKRSCILWKSGEYLYIRFPALLPPPLSLWSSTITSCLDYCTRFLVITALSFFPSTDYPLKSSLSQILNSIPPPSMLPNLLRVKSQVLRVVLG